MIPIPLLVFISYKTLVKPMAWFNNQVTQFCLFQLHKIFKFHRTLIKQYGYFKLVHFSKNLGRLSSAGPDILAFGSHCLANSQPIVDCVIPKFKLKYEDSENIDTDHVHTVFSNLHQIKQRNFFGSPGTLLR